MKSLYKLLLAFTFLFSVKTNAQVTELYCMHHSTSPVGFRFGHMLLPADTIADTTFLFSNMTFPSSTVDTTRHMYYFCNGYYLFAVNMLNDSLVAQFPSGPLMEIQFDPCDSMIYALYWDPVSSYITEVRSMDPRNGTITTLFSFGSFNESMQGAQGTIDLVHGEYIFEMKQGPVTYISGYNIGSGALDFLTPVTINFNDTYNGIAYNCVNGKVLGIFYEASTSLSYLASFDELSGNLTNITATGWSGAGTSAFMCGTCIDQAAGIYYYPGTSNILFSVDVNSGNVAATDTIAGGQPFYGLEALSQCACPLTTTVLEQQRNFSLQLFPNPAADEIDVTVNEKIASVTIVDMNGKVVYEKQAPDERTLRISLENFSNGIYSCNIRTASGEMLSKILAVNR